jgi:hypothetical protein
MRRAQVWFGCTVLSITAFCGRPGVAADTHVIVGTQQVTWTYNGQKSTSAQPLAVADLKVGDVIDIQIPPGAVPHGFVTIRRKAGQQPVEDKRFVRACGESKDQKPTAVLQEVSCGNKSQFGVRFTGDMRLEVLDTFKTDVDFWCVVHTTKMAGTLKLKS